MKLARVSHCLSLFSFSFFLSLFLSLSLSLSLERYGECYPKDNKTGCDCGTKPCGFYLFNHSSTVVINGQSFRECKEAYPLLEYDHSPLLDE